MCMQKRWRRESERQMKVVSLSRKLRRNAIKFTFLLGSLFLLRFHYAILRSNNELFRCCLHFSFIFGKTFLHMKKSWWIARTRRGYLWKDNDRVMRSTKTKERANERTNKMNTKPTAATATATNAVKTVKTCVIFCVDVQPHQKHQKWWFDGAIFFSQAIY